MDDFGNGLYCCPSPGCGATVRLAEYVAIDGPSTASKGDTETARRTYERPHHKQRPSLASRDAAMAGLSERGHSPLALAVAFGLTRQRVDQILHRAAGTEPQRREDDREWGVAI